MHLSEGILHLPTILTTDLIAFGAVWLGLRRLHNEKLPLNALFASVFFVASTIHVPVGIGSVHLILNGMAGLFLGWSVFPAFLIALLLQVVFFSFGGFAVLGANLCSMGFSALLAHYVLRPFISAQASNTQLIIVGIFAAIIGILGALFITASILFIDGGNAYFEVIYLLFISHLPVMVVDSLISCSVILLLRKMQPDMLNLISHKNHA
ncbi:cobalt transporter CbiM [Pasteurella sp. PK-2025]|uniref:cobalt transporter CbiM n=1 Tax=Pasteurella sp. PK-2025 TaxID=3413133 RepID=UPI003C763BDA